MHPAQFRASHRLSDWPECRLEIRCPARRRARFAPIAMLRAAHGDPTFTALVDALKCSACGTRPAPVFLLAGQHREHCYGGPPDWAVELRPAAPSEQG